MTEQSIGLLEVPRPLHAKHPVHRIQRAVCEAYDIAPSRFLTDQTYNIARPRQVAMYLSRTLTRSSLLQIGRRFERHHSTVIHAVRAVEQRSQEDDELRRTINSIKGSLDVAVD